MDRAVIVSAVRTPIAKMKGALKDLHLSVYGGLVIKEALNRARVEATTYETCDGTRGI